MYGITILIGSTKTLVNPWYSGLAQGQGLSVLCRAYKETKDPKYLKSLEKVLSL